MKRFQFLLLDAGPIINLFQVGLWDKFIEKCEVTITQAVADEAKWASRESEDIHIDLEVYKEHGRINVIETELFIIKSFLDKFDLTYKDRIHEGELETLAFLDSSNKGWFLCAADGAVFRVLGFLGKGERGISLEEILKEIGLSRGNMEWQYTKKFRERYTNLGQRDSIQNNF